MKTFTKSLIFSILLTSLAFPGNGQDQKEYLYKPFQITLFPSVGTNGIDYRNCVNKISINLLWGESAGLQGLELGCIANIEHDFVKGVQMAGVANIVTGNVTGLQLSQFLNVTTGKLLGAQFSGFMNISDDMAGIASAGFLNVSRDVTGLQQSGFMNYARELTGAQSAGFLNIADDVTGAQFSGFMDVAGDVKGAQVAGFINTADKVKGAQVSGFMNIAGKVKGTQIGWINIADSYEKGVPLGLINIVKNGYHDFELSGSEIWNLSLGYRLGVDRLYTQFMFGSRWDRHDNFWGLGIGIGSRFGITRYFKGSIDLTSYQIMAHQRIHMRRPNVLEQARFTVEGRIFRGMKWFAGPTFNMLVTPYQYPEPAFLASFSPWQMYEKTSGVSYVKMWPGVSAGIRF